MDDETINKNVKLFFKEVLKTKTNRTLFIMIFVTIGFIIAMFVTKNIYDEKHKYPTITPSEPVEVVNPDDEDWPDDATKTRLYNNDLTADLINAVSGITNYQTKNYGAIPYDYDSWKRAYRNEIQPLLSREYKYETCDLMNNDCKMPETLTWKDNKLTIYFATHATCNPSTKTIAKSTSNRRIAAYMHLRGESNGIICQNN